MNMHNIIDNISLRNVQYDIYDTNALHVYSVEVINGSITTSNEDIREIINSIRTNVNNIVINTIIDDKRIIFDNYHIKKDEIILTSISELGEHKIILSKNPSYQFIDHPIELAQSLGDSTTISMSQKAITDAMPKLWSGTEEEYSKIKEYDKNTIYVII